MRVGIDFGTTRIVVAAVDRGNYPLVEFEIENGETRDWFPPLVAANDGVRIYGWEAWAAQEEPGWTVVRSLKRSLREAGPETEVRLGRQTVKVAELMAELAGSLRRHLVDRSTLRAEPGEPLEAMLGVPANANSNQRFLTAEAFRAAGFKVLGLLNEPSAASIEFAHRNRSARKEPSCLMVYDLGGGTFDVSLVEADERTHSVIASAGIPTLGGDDFDEVLAELALETACLPSAGAGGLAQAEWFRLHEECRERKEALTPNTRKIVVDLDRVRPGWGEVAIPVAAFYERCRPLVEATRRVVERIFAEQPERAIAALYVTGGGSELPLVARLLRESFGRRVKRSAYMRSATAIGLAIRADAESDYVLKEQFTENFGVWREAEAGREIVFDLLFPRGTPLPGPDEPPLRRTRRYVPAHNIGHFRYLECAEVSAEGRPVGEMTVWDEIRFPFDPALRNGAEIVELPVVRLACASEVEEAYTCDASGGVAVTISDAAAGYRREYRLGRWSREKREIVPGRSKRPARKTAK